MKPSRWRIDAAAFTDLRIRCGLDTDRAARLLHVAPRTVRRWESGRCRVSYAAFRLLRLMAAGRVLAGPWCEFSVRGDTLWTPEGKAFKAADLAYLWLTFAMARRWQADYADRGRLDLALRGLSASNVSGIVGGTLPAAAGVARGGDPCGAGSPGAQRRSPRPVTRGESPESDINVISGEGR